MSPVERLPGAADAEATARAAARLGPHAAAPLGTTGLTVSRLGFGGYRVDDARPVFAEALARSLARCNLIDTSTNYTDGGSERLVGEVLAAEATAHRLRRQEVVVVSKVGYVQGQNLALASGRRRDGQPFPEMVEYMDGCWHCIHPQWLADQLERSLTRLRLETLDVLLLHNPEYFFSDAVHRGLRVDQLAAARDEFYRRLQAAFAFFESQVAAGKLRHYGVSSNTATANADDPEATSLVRMWSAAEAAGGPGHHFRVLQLPMNLVESGAVFEPNNDGATVLEKAQELGVGVLVNRPLNAIVDNRLLRLAGATGAPVTALIDEALPPERRGATPSQKALHVVTSAPGVSCVLVGMRRPAYVDDATEVLGWPRLEGQVVRGALSAIREAT
jgi:aryl-alcohol dehydrogenase-like predicted oxidoreductase